MTTAERPIPTQRQAPQHRPRQKPVRRASPSDRAIAAAPTSIDPTACRLSIQVASRPPSAAGLADRTKQTEAATYREACRPPRERRPATRPRNYLTLANPIPESP